MTVETLICTDTPPLSPSDTVEHGLGLLMEMRIRHLPVVDGSGKLVGVLSEEQLLDADGPDTPISELIGARIPSVRSDAHVFEVSKVMLDERLTTVPVVGGDMTYVGLVRRHDLFEWFARMLGTQEPGAILALEVDARDYALSRVIYAIEENNVRVLSLSADRPNPKSDRLHITMKLNTKDSARVRHILEHHGYKVIAAFGVDDDSQELADRVQEFMRYLEV
jgi:predicted transcriptional regulator